jgi:hypothetical protein
MTSDDLFIHIRLPDRPIPPAALARLFSELFEAVVVRNDSTLLVGETTTGDDGDGAGDLTLQLTVEQSTSHDVDVDALTDDLNAIVRRFTDADDPRQETSA